MSYTIGVPLGPHVLYIGVPLGPHVLYHRGTFRSSCPYMSIGVPLEGPHVLYHRGTFRSSCPIPLGYL